MWEGWARELGKQPRLISVDPAGHGLSGTWPRDEYTIEAYADFIEVLVDTLHLDRFVLVAIRWAVRWPGASRHPPDRVSQLILVDAAGYPRTAGRHAAADPAGAPAVVGDIGSTSSPSAWCTAHSARSMPDPGDGGPSAIKRYAELQPLPRQPRGHLAARRTQEPLDPRR